MALPRGHGHLLLQEQLLMKEEQEFEKKVADYKRQRQAVKKRVETDKRAAFHKRIKVIGRGEGAAAAAATAALAPEDRGDIILFKQPLMRSDQQWDAKKGKAFTVKLPDFAYELREKSNALTLRLEYYHLDGTEQMYTGVHITHGLDPAASTVCCHWTFRKTAKPTGVKTTMSLAYRLGGTVKWVPSNTARLEKPLLANTKFWLRFVLVPGGYLVYLDGHYIGSQGLPEEAAPTNGSDLFLHLPTQGDKGEKSVLKCEGAWFGHFQPSPEEMAKLEKRKVRTDYIPNQLYVTGVAREAGRSDLLAFFEAYGVAAVNPLGNGAATVTLSDPAMVQKAIDDKSNTPFMGQKVHVQRALVKTR